MAGGNEFEWQFSGTGVPEPVATHDNECRSIWVAPDGLMVR